MQGALCSKTTAELLAHVAQQIQVVPDTWTEYASRDETRREHALELQSVFGYRAFTLRAMNRRNARKVPDDAPTGFLRPRWKPYVLTETTITRIFQASPSRNAKSSVCAPRHQILPVPLAGAPPGGISVPISGPGA